MGILLSMSSQEEQNKSSQRKYYYTKRRPGGNVYKIYNNNVYWKGDYVNGVNGYNFVDLAYGYGKDNKYIFYNGEKISNISKNFQVLGKGYAKDMTRVFYRGRQISNAHSKSFKIKANDTVEDIKYNYIKGEQRFKRRQSR